MSDFRSNHWLHGAAKNAVRTFTRNGRAVQVSAVTVLLGALGIAAAIPLSSRAQTNVFDAYTQPNLSSAYASQGFVSSDRKALCRSLKTYCQREQSTANSLQTLAQRNGILETVPARGTACAWEERYCAVAPASCAVQGQVCGVDNRTYNSVCDLISRGVQISRWGACSGAASSFSYSVSNSYSSYTYSSSIDLLEPYPTVPLLSPITINPSNPILDSISRTDCNAQSGPVCGSDNRTYANECDAKNGGTIVLYHAACTASENSSGTLGSCVCTQQYSPVCATNNTTYSNECFARCAGQAVHYNGACRQ